MVKIVNDAIGIGVNEYVIVLTNSKGEITSSNIFFQSLFGLSNCLNIKQIFEVEKSISCGSFTFKLNDYPKICLNVLIEKEEFSSETYVWKIELSSEFETIKYVEQKVEHLLFEASREILLQQSSLKNISKIENNLDKLCNILQASFIIAKIKNSNSDLYKSINCSKTTVNLINEVKSYKKIETDNNFRVLSNFEIEREIKQFSIAKVISIYSDLDSTQFDITIGYKNDKSFFLHSKKLVELINVTLKSFLEKQQQSEFSDFMRFGYNNAPNPVIWINAEGEAIYCNKASKQLTGYEKFQFIGENLFEKFPQIQSKIKSDSDNKLNCDEHGLQFTITGGLNNESKFSLKIKKLTFEKNNYYCIYGININSQILTEKKLSHQKQYLVQLHKIHTSNYDSIDNLLIEYLKTGCESYKCNIGLINQYKNNTFNVTSEVGDVKNLDIDFINKFSAKVVETRNTQIVYFPFNKGKMSFIIGSPIFLEEELCGIAILCSTEKCNHQEESFDAEYIDLLSLNIANILMASNIDSERRNFEEELKKSKIRFKAIIDDQSELICRYDMQGTILFANNAYCNLMKRLPDEIIGSSVFRDENSQELKNKFFNRLSILTYEEPLTTDKEEIFFEDETGGRWIAWTDRAIFNDKKEVIEYQSVGTDITEIKKIAADQKHRIEFLQTIIDTIPNTIMVKDYDGNILMCNKTAAGKYGLTVNELVGKNDYVISKDYAKDNKFRETDLETFKNKSLSIFPDQKVTNPITNKTRYIQTYKIPIDSKNENKENILVVAIDITDRKLVSIALENSNNELKVLTEKLQKSNEELKNFAYVASHDLQEPLRMIASYIQLLDRKYGDQLDDNAKEFIHFAVDGATRMQNLISDLLEYSRIQTRSKPFKSFDLNNLIQEVLQNLEQKIVENKADIKIPDLPKIVGDRSQISRLFQNLIDNAIKFKGNENPIIDLTFSDKNEFYEFNISDNGIGISEEYMNRVFEIFNRLHSTAEYQGTGIGLSICKKIIQKHGGEIWIENNKMGGCNFIFTLKKLSVISNNK